MGFRVADAADAFRRALAKGAKPVPTHIGPMELNIPAIEGVGGALIYLVDRYGDKGLDLGRRFSLDGRTRSPSLRAPD